MKCFKKKCAFAFMYYMKVFLFLILVILSSCKQAIEKPKNLISEDEMSSLIAEFALADQMSFVAPSASMEAQTRYILKQHKIKAKDFQESYTYYTGINKLDKIFDGAENIVEQKDPKAKDYINKKLKENPLLPAMGR